MKYIHLTKGQMAIVDDEDYEYLNQWKWYAQSYYTGYYAARRQKNHNGKSILIYMHRFLNNTPENMKTDHINGDTLDNRRSNIRSATALENARNKRIQATKSGKPKSSKYKGVCWDSYFGKWVSSIRVNGSLKNLGRFHSEKAAALAYDNYASQIFGKFHRAGENYL